ncbi:isoamyl acetate-hydrolyzing esterase [Eremomyces bilateralis CBS 781.70]|uniref:Isoamyl acetate-hydrolyzing esterase n=1 Tax=Eremomyces bilateralis CBS 781.70 TaxID=1392243 RepID=A0A6G1FR84_9PEZI|nr:isoamyl acetate-hydrolyzing esterase [Eremomyces bilateralis CBS 781.70]KAF1808246.1 isoamyl acetate-hydrolyzing esterase [Eremomyces bilateralis CBS 781.70]
MTRLSPKTGVLYDENAYGPLYDLFLLLGDSITQQASSQERGFGFAAALQDAYIRKLDVVNRGLSGYNTDMAIKVLLRCIPAVTEARMRLMTVFFGANDSCWPTSYLNQSVPLPRYLENLTHLMTHAKVKAHNARIILITPPPINEYMQWVVDQAKGYNQPRRTAERTKEYAEATRELGEKLGVPVVDMWTVIMLKAGWELGSSVLPGSRKFGPNPVLEELLHDGLHLSPSGYRILYDEVLQVIRKNWPDQLPEHLTNVLPNWDNPDWHHGDGSFESATGASNGQSSGPGHKVFHT